MLSYDIRHACLIVIGAILLILLLAGLFRRRNVPTNRPTGSTCGIPSGQDLPRLPSTSSPLLNRLTGNPYQDTQLLLSPGMIICLRNETQQFLALEQEKISFKPLNSPDDFGTSSYHWIVEHSPFYCKEKKAGIRLRHRMTSRYIGWKDQKYQVLNANEDDQGKSSSFLAITSNWISPLGNPSSIGLFDLNQYEQQQGSPTENSLFLLGQNTMTDKQLGRPWQWNVISVAPNSLVTPSLVSPALRAKKEDNEFWASSSSSNTFNTVSSSRDLKNFQYSKLFHPLGI